MSKVILTDLCKLYGTTTAVDHVSLNIEHGEFVALLGPSGCGKTTTLRMIGGFVDVSSGRIRIAERDVTNVPANKRNIGLVFQNYALFPHMTVADNVAFGLKMRRVPKAEIAQRIDQALDRVRLGHLAERYPKQLSGGQQQRVALARALVIEPDVLLLDEPLSNLDAALRQEMKLEIRQLQQRLGLTTIFVTHDQDEAMSTADRMVVMNAGRIEQVGAPEDVFGKPQTRFVAEFMGFTNFLPVPVSMRGCRLGADGDLGSTNAAVSAFALRPENILVDVGHQTPGIDATILSSTFRGAFVDYQLRLDSGEVIIARRPAPGMGGAELVSPGKRISTSWEPAAAVPIIG